MAMAMEESIPDPSMHVPTVEDVHHTVTYELVEGGTYEGARTKLADSDGYSYNVLVRRNPADVRAAES